METKTRLLAGLAGGAVLGLCNAGPALAQAYPPTGGGGGTTVVTTPVSGVVEAPASLPRTGSDLLAVTALGAGAVAAGGVVLLAARRRVRA